MKLIREPWSHCRECPVCMEYAQPGVRLRFPCNLCGDEEHCYSGVKTVYCSDACADVAEAQFLLGRR